MAPPTELYGPAVGVVIGAVVRVFAVPGPSVFRLLVAAALMPLGLWLITRTLRPAPEQPATSPPTGPSVWPAASAD